MAGKELKIERGGLAYSYIRFSSLEQGSGDSRKRQRELRDRFVEKHGLRLDSSLVFEDLGKSAFSKDTKQTSLELFLEALDQGKIERGSYLLVESLDRLSRQNLSIAYNQFQRILNQGVDIVTLQDEVHYTQASLDDIGSVIYPLVVMQRANEESAAKSKRIRSSWESKRQKAQKGISITARAPLWLLRSGDSFEVIEEAAEQIRRIFELRVEGVSVRKIEEKLNTTPGWSPPKSEKRISKGWRASYIQKILSNRSVLGECQPHRMVNGKREPVGEPILGYFPTVIDEELFNRVSALRRLSKRNAYNGAGRTGVFQNLFKGLLFCPYCGSKVHVISKGSSKKGGVLMRCDGAARKLLNDEGDLLCQRGFSRYQELEDVVLDSLSTLKPELIIPQKDQLTKEIKRLENMLVAKREGIDEIESEIARSVELSAQSRTKSVQAKFIERADELSETLPNLRREIESIRAELEPLVFRQREFKSWQSTIRDLKALLASRDVDARATTQSHIRRLVHRIDVFGFGDESMLEWIDVYLDESGIKKQMTKAVASQFWKYIRARLLSREGRFFRVWTVPYQSENQSRNAFRENRKERMFIDLAPSTSLAGGSRTVEEQGKRKQLTSGPDLRLLIAEFFDHRKTGYVPKDSALEWINQ